MNRTSRWAIGIGACFPVAGAALAQPVVNVPLGDLPVPLNGLVWMDLDLDGAPDTLIRANQKKNKDGDLSYVSIMSYQAGPALGLDGTWGRRLASGELIDEHVSWSVPMFGSHSAFLAVYSPYPDEFGGPWHPSGDGYLAFRVGSGPGNYGMIYMTNTDGSPSGFVLHSFHLQTVPGHPLVAAPVEPQCPPVMYRHPQPVTISQGEVARFSAYEAGPGATYQWRRDGVAIVNDERISGATSRQLVIRPALVADAGVYTLTADTACGSVTSQGAPLTVQPVCLPTPGSALLARGTGHVRIVLFPSATAYSMAVWFKTTTANCSIFRIDSLSRGRDRDIYLSDGNLHATVQVSPGQLEVIGTSGTNYADGRWHQVVHTFGGATGGQRLFVDGVERASGTASASDINPGFFAYLGSPEQSASDFVGHVDELCIWRTSLSESEVEAFFGSPSAPPQADLLQARWRFDEGGGSNPLDEVGGHFAMLVGGISFVSPPSCCRSDFNRDAASNSQDFFEYLTHFFSIAPAADFNRDGSVNSQDFFDFLAAFFAGCP